MARYKPGDTVSLTYNRGGKENSVSLVLKNKAGNTNIVKTDGVLEKLGAELAKVDSKTAAANEISGGVVVKRINEGLLRKSRMQEGFIITSISDQPLKNLTDLERAIAANKGRKIKIEGIYPGYEGTYAYPLDLTDVKD